MIRPARIHCDEDAVLGSPLAGNEPQGQEPDEDNHGPFGVHSAIVTQGESVPSPASRVPSRRDTGIADHSKVFE